MTKPYADLLYRNIIPPIAALGSMALWAFLLPKTYGAIFFILGSGIAIAALSLARDWLSCFRPALNKIILLTFCIMLIFVFFETGLVILSDGILGRDYAPPDRMQHNLKQVDVHVRGATHAFILQGKLHVFDAQNMRRNSPFPPKRNGVCRIVAVGDSLTYGQGVDEQESYPAVLQRNLRKSFHVEVLNLGVRGYSSKDVLKILPDIIKTLRPDMVIYGVCYNDLIPKGPAFKDDRFKFPLPERMKNFLMDRSILFMALMYSYSDMLNTLGLRANIHQHILNNIGVYKNSFLNDVAAMNRLCLDSGLPPVTAMVLSQVPGVVSTEERITRILEEQMREARLTVIPSSGYYEKYHGRIFYVSPWETHPNEEAHGIFAECFSRALQRHAVLVKYRAAPD